MDEVYIVFPTFLSNEKLIIIMSFGSDSNSLILGKKFIIPKNTVPNIVQYLETFD